MHSKGIEPNVASVAGTSCTSAFAAIVHLVKIKSSDVAVFGLLQKILISSTRVMRYSQIASAAFCYQDTNIIAYGVITHQRWHLPGLRSICYEAT